MNRIKLGLCLMTVGLLGSCMSDRDFEEPIDNSTGKVNVSVGVSIAGSFTTKAIGGLDKNTDGVETVHVYVFRESGDLDAFASGKKDEDIVLEVTKGDREFFAVANPQAEFKSITKKSVLLATISKLENEKSGTFTMVGTGGVQKVENAKNISIEVARLVSRIQLQYSVDFKGTNLEGKRFTPDSVYITNAGSRASVNSGLNTDPATDLVSGGWLENISEACKLMDKADAGWGETPAAIGGNQWLSYYVYKNDAPQSEDFKDVTSLVICGRIEDLPDMQYYRVSINTPKSNVTGDESATHKYVQNNVIYSIKATIKGPGTTDPGVDPVNFHVIVKAAPWKQIDQEVEFK